MKLSQILFALCLLYLYGGASLQGQTTLVEYKFNGGSMSASYVAPSISATKLTSANTSMVNASQSSGNLYYLLKNGSGVELAHSQAEALEGTAYVSLTLTAIDNPVVLGAMTFDFGNYGTAFTLDAYAFATVTIDGVTTVYTASVFDTITETTAPYYPGRTQAGANDTFGRATIDFAALVLEGGTQAEIRLYTWFDNLHRPSGSGDLPSGTAYSLRVDNIAIVTAIPEAGSALLAVMGAIVLGIRRRVGK